MREDSVKEFSVKEKVMRSGILRTEKAKRPGAGRRYKAMFIVITASLQTSVTELLAASFCRTKLSSKA